MRILIAILALAALLAAALPGAPAEARIGLPSIKNKLIELALDQISTPGSFEVSAGSIEDLEEGVTSLVDVQVSDGEGVWLTIERLNFAWQPSALLSGELAITQIRVIGLDVSRAPSPEAEPPELKPQEPWSKGPFDWPRAPISVSIKGVQIERAHIAQGILPQAIRFDARGHALDKGDIQEVEFSLERTDEVDGRIGLLMRRDFGSGTLKLDVSASEAPGGVVAAAAGFPSDAPVRLDLEADGTVANWRLDLDTVVERVFRAGGRATLDYTERLNVEADFTVTPGPELQPELRTVLGEQARLRARIVEQPDGMIEVVEGALTSPAVQMSATGSLATGPGGESDLAVSLVALAPLADLAEGVAFDRFTFDGQVTGPMGGLAARGALGLEGLATAPADIRKLALDGRVEQTADGVRFDVSGSGEGLRLDRIAPEVIGTAEIMAKGALAGDMLTLERAALGSGALTASASGRYDLAASTGNLTLDLSAPRIAPVVGAYGVAAEGRVDASAALSLAPGRVEADLSAALEDLAMEGVAARRLALSGRVGQLGDRTSFDLEGTGEAIRLDQVPPALTREARLVARGALAEGTLDLAELRLDAPLIAAEASGTLGLEAGEVAIDYRLETPELAPVAAAYDVEATGSLKASGRAAGPLTAPRVTGEVALAKASFAGQSYGSVRLEHEVSVGPAPEGRLVVAVTDSWLGDGDARTRFVLDGGRLALSDLEATLLGASLAGSADLDLGTTLVDGSFDVSVPDLRPLGRLAGTQLSGAISGRLTLAAAEGRQDVQAALDAKRLAAAGLAVAQARATVAAGDVLGTPRLDLDLKAGGLAAGPAELETLTATVRGPLSALDFTAEARGALREDPLSASLAGRADAGGETIRLTLARAQLTSGPDTLRLERPLELRIGGGLVAAEGLALSLPGHGSLTGEAALRPSGYTGDLTLERLPLSAVGRWTGLSVKSGLLDAQAVFDTRPGSARAKASAELRKVIFEGSEAAGRTLDVDLSADWDGARHDAEVEVRGDFGAPVRARLSLPLRPRAGELPAIPPGGALDGSLAWSGRIGDLWALVPAPGHILDGDAVIDLTIGGTVDAPQVSGRAEVNDGQYQNLDLGTILTHVEIATRVSEAGAVEVTVDATDGAGGRVSARTTLDLGAEPPRLDLTASSDGAVLVRRDDVTAAVSGEVSLAGALNDLALEGRLSVDKAEVRLVNATPPEVVTLEGIRIKGAPEPDGNGDGESVVRLDLRIVAERNIFVRGRGLDSEWGMDLAVTGTAVSPVITGAIERIRGRLSLIGRSFELERGRVVFDGGRRIDPQLDVYLQREDNDLRGGIVVSGRASEPELTFSSVPALPEDEVMPRVLFGQSRQSLTGAQALQLTAGIATLMGGKAGPLDKLRETAGLDMLRVEGQSVEDAAVTVGRNVGDHVFIGAKQGLGEQGSAVTVEVEVFDNVTVDTEIGQEGNSNIGITLKKDF